MDTATHLVVGLGLAGLAYVDPVVAADSSVATAVMIGTVLGSQAPDSDGLLRLKGNGPYIKNHRGLSHSLPAVLIWTVLITAGLHLVFTDLPTWNIAFWVLTAVGLHVYSDLFNTYGTQAARPFTEKWISWNIIHIFDPFIFVSHLLAIFLWAFNLANPAVIFPLLYATIIVYYIWRTLAHRRAEQAVSKLDGGPRADVRYLVIPTIHPYVWNVVKLLPLGEYVLGEYKHGRLGWIDKVKCDRHPAIDASRRHPDIAAFLYFSSCACAELKRHPFGYEVRWLDVRYRHRKQYPFVGVLLMDHDYQPLNAYVGWLSDSKLEKRLDLAHNES